MRGFRNKSVFTPDPSSLEETKLADVFSILSKKYAALRGASMSLRFTSTLVLVILCLAVPAWAEFEAGMDANDREDYATALREWQPLAE
jgi:hypothetical protein